MPHNAKLLSILFCLFISLSQTVHSVDTPPRSNNDHCHNPNEQPWPTHTWCTANPKTHHLSLNHLHNASHYLEQNSNATSFLVVKDGYLVFEEYLQNNSSQDAVHIWSVTKSISSMLTGIAIQQGLIKETNQPVKELLPASFFYLRDERTRNISVGHILTMSLGLEWSDGQEWVGWSRSRDWKANLLTKPQIHPPGTQFEYCTACSHLLSEIITSVSNRNTLDYAKEYLFTPLNIGVETWITSPSGVPAGGHGLHLRPRDLAKLGYLYLNQGRWESKQIVPASWVQRSTAPAATLNQWIGYGYQWWTASINGINSYYASGYGGQSVWVTPSLGLVVVVTSATNKKPQNIDMARLVHERILGEKISH